jgi:hypothetical protein
MNARLIRGGILALVVTGWIGGSSQAGAAPAPARDSFPATYAAAAAPAIQPETISGSQIAPTGSYQPIAWYGHKHWWKKNAPIIGGAGGGAIVGGLLGGGKGALIGGAIGGGGGYAYKRLKQHHDHRDHSRNYNRQPYHHQ